MLMSLRLFVLYIFLIFIYGCAKKENENKSEQPTSTSVSNIAEVKSVEKRTDRASNFSWIDAKGNTVSFDSYRGAVTLINFWATWCGPCRKEMPDLIALSKELANKNVKFIGVSVDRWSNTVNNVPAFVQEAGIPYQIIIANDDLLEAYDNPRSVPVTFIIDKEGTIAQKFIGPRTKEFFNQSITALLK
jgi:thiol-disulfide isomerase/thioredoxin